jgi:hypothetical protein
MVPDLGRHLPLVDQAGRRAPQHQTRIEADGFARSLIHIEEHFAGGVLAGRCRLAARLRSLDHDRTHGLEATNDLTVRNPAAIVHFSLNYGPKSSL